MRHNITIALARRIAQAEGRNQQAAIVQTAARLLPSSDKKTKEALMMLIASKPSHRQEIVSFAESVILKK